MSGESQEDRDLAARLRAAQDQTVAALKELTSTLGALLHALIDEGFTRDEAMELVVMAYAAHLASAYGGDDG